MGHLSNTSEHSTYPHSLGYSTHPLPPCSFSLAAVGLLIKTPLLSQLQLVAQRDLVQYNRVYASSRDVADGLASRVLHSVRTVALLQAHGAHEATSKRYAGLQALFIHQLQLTHLRQVCPRGQGPPLPAAHPEPL